MNKVKVGIIGCGGIANAKHMPSLSKIEEVEIIAFCDLDIEKARKSCEEFGAEGSKVYTNYKELLDDKLVDVIHVCTPNKSHSFISIDAMEAGMHVMCEKPMAKTYAEAKEMLETSKRTGKKLTIGYQNRYREDSQHLSALCKDGELGNIYYAKAHALRRRAVPTWGVFLNEEEQGGGSLIDIGTHALDLTLWLMDNYKPKYVVGNVHHAFSDRGGLEVANPLGDWNKEEFTVEDSAFGYITMEDGSSIVLESSWALNTLDQDEAKTSLHGTLAGADMKDGLRINGNEHGRMFTKHVITNKEGVPFFDADGKDESYYEQRGWIDAIINDTDPLVLPEQALVVTQILEAIYESSKTKKPVLLGTEE